MSYAQPEEVFRLPFPQRYIYIDTFFKNRENDPSVRHLIAQWQEEAITQHDQRSHLLLALRDFNVLVTEEPAFPGLSRKIDSIIVVAAPFKDSYLLASAHMQRAWLHEINKDYPLAFESFLETYSLIKSFTPKEFPNRDYFLYTIANIFYRFNDFDKAIEIASQVTTVPDVFDIRTLYTNLLGMCYLKKADYDSASHWFNECKRSVSLPDHWSIGWQGLTSGNIGYTWYEQREFDKAIPFFEEGILKTDQDTIWDNKAGFCCAMADIYLQRNDMAKAKNYLQQASDATSRSNSDDNLYILHRVLSQFYRATGEDKLALSHLDTMLIHKANIETFRDSKFKVQAEYKFYDEKRTAEANLLRAETQRHKLFRNLLIGILFLLMVLSVLYFNRRELKHRYVEKQLEFEKKQAEEELASAQTQLDDFTRRLKEKNSLIEKFSDEILKLQSLPCNVTTPEQSAMLNELRLSAILTDKDWEEFRNRFEKVHGGFLQRLRVKLPDLSPAETRFIALAKLQLNNKEMGSILGISPDSIRTIRYRLRKKLQLDEEGNMEELIDSI